MGRPTSSSIRKLNALFALDEENARDRAKLADEASVGRFKTTHFNA
ncbi:MAG TPA: hypothetical protein V6C95_02970 [Coleofasciculaceae cyanobacterium]